MANPRRLFADVMTDDLSPPMPTFSPEDEAYMRRALQLAGHARDAENEVPVGAVLSSCAWTCLFMTFSVEADIHSNQCIR